MPQGSGSGLDADTLDGLHARDILTRRNGAVIMAVILGALFILQPLGGLVMGVDVSSSGRRQVIDPIQNAVVVTPSDTTNLPYVTTSLRLAAAGAVRVTLVGGATVTYPSGALAVGISHPMRVVRVWATGTTVPAGNIIAEW